METFRLKNILIGFLLCSVAALAIGIEPVERIANEALNKGKVRGVEKCLSYSDSELLSADAVRAMCIRTFQRPLYDRDHATGRAGPRMDNESMGWGGFLENKTSDYVTTWVKIAIGIYDADGDEKEFFVETPIWIDPLGETEFLVETPDIERKQIESIDFCDHDDPAPTSCLTWGITEMKGLGI